MAMVLSYRVNKKAPDDAGALVSFGRESNQYRAATGAPPQPQLNL